MKILDISDNALTAIPEELCEIKTLEVLNISNNNLRKLPEDLAKLSKLRVLGMEGNILMEFPECVCELSDLLELKASNNCFQVIPENFGQKFKQLNELLLSDNKLKSLPDSICDLVNLTTLDLRNNKLKRLPANFGNLENLGKVEDSTFSVEHNPLEDPPLEICIRGIDVIREYQSGSGFLAVRKKVAEKQKLKKSEVTSSTLSLASQVSEVDDKEYRMDRKPRGIAIVIDNLGIYNTVTGNESDSEKLSVVFTKLGFVVRLYRDRTSEEISQIMEVLGMEDHPNSTACWRVSSHMAHQT
ncbi:uncharacterized protein [Ptychodera flava]|uniref:uncharacterized protein n=1 Tax=Ptychodera flava TaxID=63121 RepID=UPI00396A2FFE